ncbi:MULTISPECIES: BlaI/MecI/CopY family transcriptional regulator [Paenibacillus]|jgi:predicted transcriptional regulator|uniref:Penicillinase repressor n=1 Tax=Paenibacillus odorifer TaxID=189426 RepID=A0A1R0X3Y1_9BACL|nr:MULTISPECIES: BlaI/MecI/CopY family transcriptional regulator [Paenibacillus]ETT67570.1 penicillinase repressor [Paenibacillus sp. FSL H8-237]OMC74465.1 hypothetical protein BK121_00005 [Paenibacillus odorifer]OMC88080.1 hypothetical protein BSO21_34885 [Paenibacillus odorifer]OMD28020.1 hypothetical protein BJP51_02635 [Paenibacillus odorifer]OMD58988.1 hypothetical protein BSK55_12800 [Paenibacillus odorifer]
MSYTKLTNRELEIMHILWKEPHPLTATNIFEKIEEKFSIYSIQNALQSLLTKNAIEVAAYTKVFKTTARKYRPIITTNDYAVMQFAQYYSTDDAQTGITELISTLFKFEDENIDIHTIDRLEKLIKAKKTELEQTKLTQKNGEVDR